MSKRPVDKKSEPPTTGHVWDGIQEYDNPMPRWWLWIFYLTIIWGIGYTILYPAWPLVDRATQGIWGGNTRQAVAADIARFAELNAALESRLVATDLTAISADPELQNFTQNAGRAVFRTWCAQCHGSGAAGARGFPNLLDNDWLWGGTIEDIHLTVSHGIRNTTDADARFSQMPAFGDILEEGDIDAVVNHVLAISGQDHDAALATQGATVFADNCASCHMEDGTGDRMQGAPNLTDAIWLWGGDASSIRETVTRARFGVMPAWTGKLSEAEIRAVSAYVHGLGGGE